MKNLSGFAGGGGAHVQRLIAGTGIALSPSCGVGNVTINSAEGSNIMIVDGGLCSTFRCGVSNSSYGSYSFSGGGQCNAANGNHSFIGGGLCNCATACSAVLGGFGNNVSASFSGAFGCNLNACNACSFYVNNLCSCGGIYSANLSNCGYSVCVGQGGELIQTLPVYGSFYDTNTQCATLTNTEYLMCYNSIDLNYGITINNGTRITVPEDGVYNIQFSAQIDRVAGSGEAQFDIWLKKQGTSVPWSATGINVNGNANKAKVVAAWNFFVSLNANQYAELAFATTDTNVRIVNKAASSPVPAIPSVILTINKISYI